MDTMTKIHYNLFLSAIKGSFGNQSTIAQRLGVERSAVGEYIKRYPELRQKLEEEDKASVDFVASKALKRIQEGSDRLIGFWLERKGKNMGFAQKTEIENTGDSAKFEEVNALNLKIMDILDKHPEARKDVLNELKKVKNEEVKQ